MKNRLPSVELFKYFLVTLSLVFTGIVLADKTTDCVNGAAGSQGMGAKIVACINCCNKSYAANDDAGRNACHDACGLAYHGNE